MMHAPRHFSGAFESERRLIYKFANNIEVLPELEKAILDNDTTKAAEIMDTTNPAERSDILQKTEKLLRTQKLTTEQQRLVDANLEHLRRRVNFMGSKLAEKIPGTEAKNERTWYDPRGWNIDAATAGVFAAGAVVTYGLYRFFRWMTGGAKKGVEKAAKGMHWMTKMIILGGALGLAGLAAVVGWKKMQDYLKNYAHELTDKTVAKVQDVIDQGKEKARQAGEKVVEGAHTAGEKVKAGAKSVKDRAKETASKVPEKTKQQAAEVAKAGAEIVGESLLTSYLISFENHPDIQWPNGTSAENHKEKISGILNEFHNRKNFTMKEIFDCLRWGAIVPGSIERLYPFAKENPAFKASVELIIRACAKHRSEVEKVLKDKIQTLTFAEYIKYIAGYNENLVLVQQEVEKHGLQNIHQWNLSEIWNSLKKDSFINADLIALVKGNAEFQEWAKKKSLSQEAMKQGFSDIQNTIATLLAKFKLDPNASVTQVRSTIAGVNLNALENEYFPAYFLVKEMLRTLPTAEELQPFFHNVFPQHQWVKAKDGQTISPKNKKILESYLENDMSFAKAMRLALYRRMMQRSNPAGVVLMQVEVLKFIREKEPGMVSGYIKTASWRAGQNMIEGLVDGEFATDLQKVFQTSEQMIARVYNAFSCLMPTAGKQVAATVGGAAVLWLEPAIAFIENNPKLRTAAATAGSSLAGLTAYNIWMGRRGMRLENLLHKRGTNEYGIPKILANLRLGIDPDLYARAHQFWEPFWKTAIDLPETPIRNEIHKAVSAAIGTRGGASDQALTDLLKILHDRRAAIRTSDPLSAEGLENMAKKLGEFLDPRKAEARRAFRIATHPARARIGTHTLPVIGAVLGMVAAGHDITQAWQYASQMQEAQKKGKTELVDMYERLKYFNYGKAGIEGMGGPLLYFVPLRYNIAGAIGTVVAEHGLESLARNTEGTLITDQEARTLTKEELIKRIEEHSQGTTSWGHVYQFALTLDDTRLPQNISDEVLQNQNRIRDNYCRGYIIRRLLQKAQNGDLMAMSVAQHIFDDDGTEKKDVHHLNMYVQYVQDYLEKNHGTRNDLQNLRQNHSLRLIFEQAELSASLRLNLNESKNAVGKAETLKKDLMEAVSELQKTQARLAFSPDEEGASLLEKNKQLQERIFELQAELTQVNQRLAFFNGMKFEGIQGNSHSMLDIGKERLQSKNFLDFTVADAAPFVSSYRTLLAKISKATLSSPDMYDFFIARAENLHGTMLKAFGQFNPNIPNGHFTLNTHHYEAMQEYAFLLDAHPEFDTEGTVRKKIWQLPSNGWNTFFGQEHPHKEKFMEVRDAIAKNIEQAKQLKHKYIPLDKEKDPPSATDIILERRAEENLHISNPTIIVTIDGKEQELRADVQNTMFGTPLGTFLWWGTRHPEKHWTFMPTKAGKFHIHSKNDLGIDQPGTWYTIKEKPTKEITLPEHKDDFDYMHDSLSIKVFLKNGQILEQKNFFPNEKGLPADDPLRQHIAFERRMMLKESAKSETGYVRVPRGWNIKPINKAEIERIELTSINAPDKEKTVLKFGGKPSSTSPTYESETPHKPAA